MLLPRKAAFFWILFTARINRSDKYEDLGRYIIFQNDIACSVFFLTMRMRMCTVYTLVEITYCRS